MKKNYMHKTANFYSRFKVPDRTFMVHTFKLRTVHLLSFHQCRVVDPDPGSGSVLDPYSVGSVDPDPFSESGSGSRRAKMTHKSRQ
jgi:hypothetical protein